ncbi:lipoate--protein ligase family protein [Companilactobacillus nuruki]|uniref:Lipoate--protein ligase n=1 Tax=Companilactobacillus nuruki TaxID=1993540 RepID=A0A2N7ARY0_9LACO|nr:lipoate--protein ligase family protein [Companilactobacillus nuruki]PMD68121.1 lipoate--protein ligase [Companilactobacillus nuruki]
MNNTIILYDQKISSNKDLLVPFSDTGAILKFVSENSQPVIHFWVTPPTVILGMQDKRLHNLQAGLEMLSEKNYLFYLRNSGGLGVVTDNGILNCSIFLPDKDNLQIDDAYEKMYSLLRDAFSEQIKTGEIKDSYCPGSFDLSIDGKKFAGISQRRTGNAVAIMAYISINGNQKKRSQLMKDFYEISNFPKHNDFSYPNINVHSMENLDVLLNTELTITEAKQKIIHVLRNNYTIDQSDFFIIKNSLPYREAFNSTLKGLIKRNQFLLEEN